MVKATWCAATATVPAAAATYVASSRAARSVMVRTMSGTPACAAARMPGRSGRSERVLAPGAADHDGEERDGHAGLGQHRAQRRAGDAEAGGVDQHEVQDDVRHGAERGDDQRRAVSCSPRSTPVAARTTSIAGSPRTDTRR